MQYDTWQSLPQMFFEQAARHAGRPYLRDRREGQWHARNYGAVASEVRQFASALAALGLEPGERVALIAENRPEWTIADLAIMAAGGISVPAFTTNTVTKAVVAWIAGGPAFALRVIPGVLLMLAAAGAGALFMGRLTSG